jgi:hypothetical protein
MTDNANPLAKYPLVTSTRLDAGSGVAHFGIPRKEKDYLAEARASKQSPRIVVIGATSPSEPYRTKHGFGVGYEIRRFLEGNLGTVATGGVEGIGADVYAGVLKYCVDNKPQRGKIPTDKFFVIIPDSVEYPMGRKGEQVYSCPYSPPHIYKLLAKFSRTGKVDVVRAGTNMFERRLYLAQLADILVVINGGPGTDHESFEGLKLNKPVITLPYTGGTAELLMKVKTGEYKKPLPPVKEKKSIWNLGGFDLNDIKSLAPEPLAFETINPELIRIVNSKQELVGELERLVQEI